MNYHKYLPIRLLIIFAILLTIVVSIQPASVTQAAPMATSIIFTIDAGDNGLATIVKTVSGVTMTLSNSTCNGASTNFTTDNDGIYLIPAAECVTYSQTDTIQISFDTPVAFDSYVMRYHLGGGGTFDLTTSNGSSTGNVLNPAGTYSFNGYLSVAAGEVVTLTTTIPDTGSYDLDQIQTITVLAPTTTTQSISNGGGSATLEGVQITNNSTNTCDFTVTHAPIPPGYGNPDNGEMPIQWKITTDGNCGTLDVDLVFNYTDTELGNGGAITEGDLTVYKHTGGTTWTDQVGTVNTGANTVTLTGVTALSDWTLGDETTFGNNAPTAVTLQSISANSNTAILPILIATLLLALVGRGCPATALRVTPSTAFVSVDWFILEE